MGGVPSGFGGEFVEYRIARLPLLKNGGNVENEHNKAAETRMEDPAGILAVTLLAHNDMENLTEVNRLLRESDRATLGRTIVIWYQMCQGERGSTATTQAARIVAQKLQTQLDNLNKDMPHEEYRRQGLPLSFGRGLMLHLSQDEHERFTEMWMRTVAPDEDLTVDVASVFLGFARSVLAPPSASADCE
jgi:hypothetical protein